MRQLLKWLYPGLGLKRWLLFTLLGFALLLLGVAVLLNVRVLVYLVELGRLVSQVVFGRPLSWLSAVGLVLLGLAMFVGGLYRLSRSVLFSIVPAGDSTVVDILYRQRRLRQGPKIVAIGGGTGLSVLLRGLKQYTSNITAVVTVTDDGGSSGRLRGDLGMLPPGDARNCLVALADTENLMEELFNYRFAAGELEGHNLGNLFLAAMTDIKGSFDRAVLEISKVLAVRGRVFPSTLRQVTLKARMKDGRWVEGETEVVSRKEGIQRVFLEPEVVEALPEVLKLIKEADAVVLGPGSLYTSIIPNLLVKGIVAALLETKAPVFYICNVMTQPGETDGFTASDHLKAIHAHTGSWLVDHVVLNSQEISSEAKARYAEQGAQPVVIDAAALAAMPVNVVQDRLVDDIEVIRHDPDRLARRLIREIFQAKSMVERIRLLNVYLGQRIQRPGEMG